MAQTASKPAGALGATPLVCASAGVYFLFALVPVARLMATGWRSGTGSAGVPWGDVCVLLGGTVAAATAARAIAFSSSIGGALRAAGTAHGAAAIATVAVCAGLLTFPEPQPLIGARTTESFGRLVYTRAVEPFFLFQLALGLAAALAFRTVTRRVLSHRAPEPLPGIRGEGLLAALSVACFLAVLAGAYAAFPTHPWPAFAVHDSPDARLAFVLRAIPVLMGSLAAASSAGRIARARLEHAIGLAVVAQCVAAAAAVLLVGLGWAIFRSSAVDPMIHRSGTPLPGVLLHVLAGTTASLLFWALAPGAEDGRTASPVDRAPAPLGSTGGPNPVLVTCAGALLYYAAALVPVLGFMDRGWQPRPYSRWPAIPGADLLVLALGTLAMAVAAAPLARARSLARALDVGSLAHLAGALVTAALSAFVIVPGLPPGRFLGVVEGARGVPITEDVARSVAPYAVVQLVLGLAVALVLFWWTRGSRLRRGSELSSPRPSGDGPNEVRLAALAVACFLILEAYPVVWVAGMMNVPGTYHAGDGSLRTGIALVSIPLLLGVLVSASSASALARSRSGVAAALGAFLHFGAAACVAPLAAPGFVARQWVEGQSLADAVLIGSHWFVGPYGAGIYMGLIPMVLAQTAIGTASTLLFRVLARPWARAGG